MRMNKNEDLRCWTCSLVLPVSSQNLWRILNILYPLWLKHLRTWERSIGIAGDFNSRIYMGRQQSLSFTDSTDYAGHSLPLQSLFTACLELITLRNYLIYLLTSLLLAHPNSTLCPHLHTGQSVRLGNFICFLQFFKSSTNDQALYTAEFQQIYSIKKVIILYIYNTTFFAMLLWLEIFSGLYILIYFMLFDDGQQSILRN